MLRHAVGKNATNHASDVKVIQTLLNTTHRNSSKKLLTVDGLYGNNTATAIEGFQSRFMRQPDGVISPYKNTIKRLWPTAYSNPTGKGIRRMDPYGSGEYGASRGSRTHDGVDYIAQAEQNVVAPISGRVLRISWPYASGIDANVLEGVEIEASDGTRCWVWYIKPSVNIINQVVKAGVSVIGRAKTLSNRYSKNITDHVHVRMQTRFGSSVNPSTVIK